MMTDVISYMNKYKILIDKQLSGLIKEMNITPRLKDAMLYSVEAGGKRLRPVLMLSVIESFGKDPTLGMIPGCSLEMLHTYSLIHDDLPAMDNDDLRRGLPTNHKKFGEATAILAGDALLTLAFECLVNAPGLTAAQKVELVRRLANAAGPEGMVGGQSDDLEAEQKSLQIEELEQIHLHKTGRLLEYAIEAGAIIAGVPQDIRNHLKNYARHLGIAFQIKDDLLDVEGDESVIGKPIGSDNERGKNTYPSLLTTEGAREHLNHHFQQALVSLREANIETGILVDLARFIVERKY
ncbi:MAG: polyprenyl synthetase family protein [Tuberibacillus sp.]